MESNDGDESALLQSFDYKAAYASNVAWIALPNDLERIIDRIARTGMVQYDWTLLKPLFRLKIVMIVEQYFQKHGFTGPVTETFETRRNELLEFFESHEDSAPFTIQRLAELLLDCSKQYTKTHKLMNAIEKLVLVTSSCDDDFS